MRRFELVENTSSKFWEVEVEDLDLTVRYGRIGTGGQSKTKTFASHAAALAEEAKLIKEKTGKGYQEIGAAPTAAPPAAKPAADKAQAKPAAKAKPAPEPAHEPAKPLPAAEPKPEPAALVPTATLEWPTGGFEWDDKLRAKLPIIRGINAPEFKASANRLAKPPAFKHNPHIVGWAQPFWDKLVQAGRVGNKTPWTEAEAAENLAYAYLKEKDPDRWREIIFQCAARFDYYNLDCFDWAVECLVAAHSLVFATEVLLDAGEVVADRFSNWYGRDNGYVLLRKALAAAPEAEWRQAREVAEGFRGRSGPLDCVISYLFAENQQWADDAAALDLPLEQSWWLNQSALSTEAACRYYRKQTVYIEYVMPAVLLQIHLHGEAALPFLELILDKAETRDAKAKFLKFMRKMRTPGLIPVLIARIEDKEACAALDTLAEQWPAAALKCAVERACATRSRAVEGWALRFALRLPQAVEPALAACSAADRERFAGLLEALAGAKEAALEELPDLLREPPWTQAKRPAALPTLDLAPQGPADAMVWPEGLKERWLAAYEQPVWLEQQWRELQKKEPTLTAETFYLRDLNIKDTAHAKVLAGEPVGADDIVKKQYYYTYANALLMLPETAALAAWNSLPMRIWASWHMEAALSVLFARYGLGCLPGLLAYVSSDPASGFNLALPFRAAKLAPLAAHVFKNLKKAKPAAMQWLRTHAETALAALIPQAFGKDRLPRENAQATLRWMAQNGFEAPLRDIAAQYGEAAAQAVGQLLSHDPMLIVPAKMPKLPAFFVPGAFHRPVLKTGGALPLSAASHLGSMLTISSLQAPYVGLEIVKEVCTSASLAEFAWDVFEAWSSAGAPSKEGWAFTALGLIGDDETARRLAPKIRDWPGEAAHARAVAGLDLLATIGTDVALMHLNGIANKSKFKGLQEKAREKIAQVAEARGLSTDELADRLVPDLGLDEDGTALLDFGPRRFYIGFDETLKPFVKDADGARLKDLPKPNKADDAELAVAATERYKALKKDAKAIASMQITRMEQIMCKRRRWGEADFRLFFVQHPLLRHLARRLVWGVYRDGALMDAFRVAEDLSLADRADDTYTLPEGVEVGIAHTLEMPADLSRDFGQVFADYEILQPFRQLGRETYALNDEERKTNKIERFKGKKVATGSVMGLINKGWERGDAQDSGWVGWFNKRLGDGWEAELQLDPGMAVGYLDMEPEQTIPMILVRRRGTWDDSGLAKLASLDAILVSEILRDADLLAPLAK